jgi:hypothetical protein
MFEIEFTFLAVSLYGSFVTSFIWIMPCYLFDILWFHFLLRFCRVCRRTYFRNNPSTFLMHRILCGYEKNLMWEETESNWQQCCAQSCDLLYLMHEVDTFPAKCFTGCDMNHKTLGTMSLTDLLMEEITNVYGWLLWITCFVSCTLLIVLEVTGTERGNAVVLPHSRQHRQTEATWLEFKAITWLNARFPVRPGHSPTQLPVDGQAATDWGTVWTLSHCTLDWSPHLLCVRRIGSLL